MIARQIALSFGLIALGAVGAPQSSIAQRVSADIRIGSGPVAGTIRIGDRPYSRVYGRPRRAYGEVAYPTGVSVERRHGWNQRNRRNSQLVIVYYDRDCDLYFDRYSRGLEEVRVFQDGGRYFRYDDSDRDDRGERWGRNDRNRDRDRDRDDHDRYDRRDKKNRDWYYERNGRNENDGHWEHDHQH